MTTTCSTATRHLIVPGTVGIIGIGLGGHQIARKSEGQDFFLSPALANLGGPAITTVNPVAPKPAVAHETLVLERVMSITIVSETADGLVAGS